MKREMTDEIRKQLSGLLPFAPGSLLPFTPEAFQKVEQAFQPKFFLRDFLSRIRKEVDAKIAAGQLDRDSMIWALSDGEDKERALGGWETVLDLATGNPIAYSKEGIATLPDHTLAYCFWRAMEFSGMTNLEREALESQPPSASEQSNKIAENADASPA